MGTTENPRPPFPPFDAESAAKKVRMAEDAWNTRDPERVCARLYAHQHLAQPVGVPDRPRGHRPVPDPQVEQGTGLSAHQGTLGLPRQPHRGALRLRMARRRGELVPLLRQRELGVQRARLHAAAHREHQRPADQGERAQVSLAARAAAGRSSRPVGTWPVVRYADGKRAETSLDCGSTRPPGQRPNPASANDEAKATQRE